MDVETYVDYFLVGFQDVETEQTVSLEMHDGQPLDIDKLRRFVRSFRLVTFNGNRFDMPIVALALSGASCALLKSAANRIISNNLQPWQFEREFGVTIPKCDHIDIFDVAPGMASLKIYGGRLHYPKMQDLPYAHDASLLPEQREVVRLYNVNDLGTTRALFQKLLPQIELRERMSQQYGMDLRSKSDAQIAEAVIVHEIERLGRKVVRPELSDRTTFKYRVPDFINFSTDACNQALEMVRAATFGLTINGSVDEPDEFKNATVQIGSGVYRLGIGGLHSSEKRQAVEADDEWMVVDRDVASYYPAIILGQRLAPKQMGVEFTRVYRGIVQRRLDAKRTGDKVTADALKITINGSFGKVGSKWSKLYAPDLLIQTTLTGQLALLMLIEALEGYEFGGVHVASANTDGIVIRFRKSRADVVQAIVADWEKRTGFETEETPYRAVYSRDVNNYIAIKPDGGVKLKGAYAGAALMKNPTTEICNEAAVRWLRDGTPVERTVRECRDLRKFVTIRQVKGGAVKGEQYLGKAVRWYYSTDSPGAIQYKVNGYTVARSDGARPLMGLPDDFPDDVNFDWYINETADILSDVGGFNTLE